MVSQFIPRRLRAHSIERPPTLPSYECRVLTQPRWWTPDLAGHARRHSGQRRRTARRQHLEHRAHDSARNASFIQTLAPLRRRPLAHAFGDAAHDTVALGKTTDVGP
jgi:hypothetical protein